MTIATVDIQIQSIMIFSLQIFYWISVSVSTMYYLASVSKNEKKRSPDPEVADFSFVKNFIAVRNPPLLPQSEIPKPPHIKLFLSQKF